MSAPQQPVPSLIEIACRAEELSRLLKDHPATSKWTWRAMNNLWQAGRMLRRNAWDPGPSGTEKSSGEGNAKTEVPDAD